MKQSEIDKAVNDWTDGFGGSTVEIAQLKKDVAAISFRAGAEMVNEKQPYSAQEMYLNMQYYMEYCEMKGYVTPQDWIEKHKHF